MARRKSKSLVLFNIQSRRLTPGEMVGMMILTWLGRLTAAGIAAGARWLYKKWKSR